MRLSHLVSGAAAVGVAGMLHFDSRRGVAFRMVRLNYKKCFCLHIIVTNISFRHLMVAANCCCRSLIRMALVSRRSITLTFACQALCACMCAHVCVSERPRCDCVHYTHSRSHRRVGHASLRLVWPTCAYLLLRI